MSYWANDVFPKNDVHEIHAYINKSVKCFIDCPYGLCWYKNDHTYFVNYYVLFYGCQYFECTFKEPYSYPVIVNDDGEELDYEEECERNNEVFRAIQHMYCKLTVSKCKHRHTDVECDTDAGEIMFKICNMTYGTPYEVTKLSEFERLYETSIETMYISTCDMSILKRMSHTESQYLINLVYPFIEGEDACLWSKNQRLGGIHVKLTRLNPCKPPPVNMWGNTRSEGYVESEYAIDYKGMDWNEPTRNEMINRGIFRSIECDY